MRRLLLAATSVAILLLALVPAAFAADPVGTVPVTSGTAVTSTGDVALAVRGTLDIPAGTSVRAAIVIDGTATVAGTTEALMVIGGTATLDGATVDQLLVVDGHVDLVGTTTVGEITTMGGTVARDGTVIASGQTAEVEAAAAAIALILVPLALLFAVGLALAALVAGLLVAAFGARQVRDLETRISRQPGQVLLAGIVGTIALPLVGVLLVLTVIGAPIGLFLLLVGVPALAFIGWLVAAIWVGNWLLARGGAAREVRHPYRAAVLGVVVLAAASILPLVSGVATVFGLGAMLLAGWDAVKPDQPAETVMPMAPATPVAPVAPGGPSPDGGSYQPAPIAG